ncbi:chromatin assembly factor 1 P55 subunit, putative [Plasmodium berghei]|uniref:Chromatin assembly factor 1 P55 subunit, putative n=2 Tax=Plasmodium berghei TaxID=5821 RepID=A0A509AMR1_PLABA|nr:chromatin assembly factor 1 P55 subunit, putative [Plasmodium berghei ANKA]CXI50779.1 chromatin assembly factor 1 P55 subunit, putative [Plasmodium berghei]SCL94323.1 chromatin assembly factor 1 P55 subunit, putative [Plasmodium berghei]SCM15990.1 chromatin assembly factor 1 P55 subunit, putative [Plasmodium berghei]SCM17786.1 chromatin assembly factor 1 P55 subunit, putative [Plasmodium berghei]SCN26019.1 chromatin assembly factor 1 P55 subunit, putative [Plasmodium berghei]|eukprot:XP_034421915.1 chromatin assembly factor 1 P55 subunit, putative [Plasmodium berghei ANKA]
MKKQGNNLNNFNDINNKNDESQSNYINANVENSKYWQYNTILLYNVIMIYRCEWPSLFVEWMPNVYKLNQDYYSQDLILGTYSTEKNNYILVLEVSLPSEELSQSNFYYDKICDFRHNSFNDTNNKFKIKKKIYHECEINKISCNPEKTDVIACFSSNGNIHILNLNDYEYDETELKNNNACNFDYTLKAHSGEGWGLKWDKETKLISSCADDSYLCIWDINSSTISNDNISVKLDTITNSSLVNVNNNSSKGIIYPVIKFFNNNIPLEDCCWRDQNILTVSDDGQLHIYDIRSKNAVNSINVTNHTLNAVDVNPHNTNIFATGGTNKEIDLWDIRYTNKSLHRIISQKENIIKLQWDKHQPGILSSSSSDKYIYFFDTNKIGIEQTYEDSQDGPPELIFIHGGHSSNVLDFSLNSSYSMMISSISEDNSLHIWQPSRQAYEDESDSHEDTEVE